LHFQCLIFVLILQSIFIRKYENKYNGNIQGGPSYSIFSINHISNHPRNLNFAVSDLHWKYYNMDFLFFQTDAPNGVRTLKHEKIRIIKFFFMDSLDWKYHRELISDIKNYEGSIDFKLIDVIIFGTKMWVIYDDDLRWVIFLIDNGHLPQTTSCKS
jgi:hypothetical protein